MKSDIPKEMRLYLRLLRNEARRHGYDYFTAHWFEAGAAEGVDEERLSIRAQRRDEPHDYWWEGMYD